MQRPELNEYKPYFQSYIDLVGEGDFLKLLIQNKTDTITFFEDIPEEKHNYRYAENKWTIKDSLMHIIDTERVFCYRALACSRSDKSPLPNMDENLYAQNADASSRTLKSLIKEFEIVRDASIILFEYMSDSKSKLTGNIGGSNSITARALGYLIIGHARHHFNVINERYL